MASNVIADCNPNVIFAKRALKDMDQRSQSGFYVSLSAVSTVSDILSTFNATCFDLVCVLIWFLKVEWVVVWCDSIDAAHQHGNRVAYV